MEPTNIETVIAGIKEKFSSQKTMPMTNGDDEMGKRKHYETLERAGIPKRFINMTFAQIQKQGVPEQIKPNFFMAKDYAASLGFYVAKGEGVLFTGAPGTMKTTLAVAILRHWLDGGGSGLFVPMPSLIDSLFTMKAYDKEEWARYEKRIRKTKILVLDDLGAELTGQEWIVAKVDSIITDRYNNLLPTIITTNLTAAKLKEKYPERFIDRIKSTSIRLKSPYASLR